MENDKLNQLIGSYLDGTCSAKERKMVEDHFLHYVSKEESTPTQEQLDRSFHSVYGKLRPLVVRSPQQKVRLFIKRILPYAAALVLLAGMASIYFLHIQQSPLSTPNANTSSASIQPGSNRATLLLDDGKTINLDAKQEGIVMQDGHITYTDGSQLAEGKTTNATQYYTVVTPRGGMYQLRLPDGTHIWLNADSRISYAADLNKKTIREVRLEGEAYFEVAKDAHRPFVLHAGEEEVTVLGTQFNVNSYPNEASKNITLVEGSVRINEDIVLKPGQQGLVDEKSKLRVLDVNTAKVIAWKHGKFVFEEESLESVMKKIGRWYDVEPVYKSTVSDKTFSGTLSRFEDIQKLLDKITYTSEVRFKIEGRRIIVMP